MARWTASDIPTQQGRLAIVTGTGGLGLEDALALAGAGAHVIIAGRNPQKGNAALARIRNAVPGAEVGFEQVDLASLASISDFARRIGAQYERIDLLINNAGVMVPPVWQGTEDGFELQFGTNYLSHFALTAHLLPLLRQSRVARVVTLSSVAARQGKIDLDDLQSSRSYNAMQAYSQSKLACLMFALELQRRSVAGGWGVTSLAAHPGVSRTDLLHNGPGRWSVERIARSVLWFAFQPVWQGALPTLYAATAKEAKGGAYYGPDRMGEIRGYPAPAKVPPLAMEQPMADALWQASERLAGVQFPA